MQQRDLKCQVEATAIQFRVEEDASCGARDAPLPPKSKGRKMSSSSHSPEIPRDILEQEAEIELIFRDLIRSQDDGSSPHRIQNSLKNRSIKNVSKVELFGSILYLAAITFAIALGFDLLLAI